MPHFAVHQSLRDHAHHLAAGRQRRIGHGAHQAHMAAAVHEAAARFSEQAAELLCGIGKSGRIAEARATVNRHGVAHAPAPLK